MQATRGKVIVSNQSGQVVPAWYSSTTGGYLISYTSNSHSTPAFWDTKCTSQSCWTGDAYEKIANSPWFYKGWYTQSYSNSSGKCGKSHPWLTQEEFADILNAWSVLKRGEDSRVLPVTIQSCPIGGSDGTQPYSISELLQKAESFGEGYRTVTGVNVAYSTNGYTQTVTLSTDRGSVSVSGEEFRKAFNLRAPGYIALRSPLYNIEMK